MQNSQYGVGQNPYYATGAGGAAPVVVQGQVVGSANVYNHSGNGLENPPKGEYHSNAGVTKGEHQPKRCNDVFWAILFNVHLCVMAYLAIANSPQMFDTLAGQYSNNNNNRRMLSESDSFPTSFSNEGASHVVVVLSRAVSSVLTDKFSTKFSYGRNLDEDQNEGNDNDEEFDIDPNDVLILLSVTGVVGLAMSSFSLTFMMYFAEFLIKSALFFNIFTSILMAIAGLLSSNIVLIAMGVLYLAMSVYYTCLVWARIPFAAQNLITAVTAVKANIGVTFFAYVSLLSLFGWSLCWGVSAMSTIFVLGDCDGQGQCQNEVSGIIVFLLTLSFYWTCQVIKNVVHVTVSGTVGTWWFVPSEATSFCSSGVRDSFFRSITYSFGSICLGSLIVAIVQAVRDMLRRMREGDDGILLCIADCCLGCIERIIEYFNEWAYVYVGIYGYTFVEAAKGVLSLFKSRGWTSIITDNLISNVLVMVSIGVGVVTGIIGAVVSNAKGMDLEIGGFIIGFIFGFSLTQVLMGVVGSAVNAVIVCYAEDPNAFQANHPQLSDQMRSAWKKAWPSEFQY